MAPAAFCGQCEAAVATLACGKCDEVFCKPCADVIHSRGKLKLHGMTAVVGGVPTSGGTSVEPRCPTHPDEKLSMLCLVCRKIVCPQCLLVGACKGHTCGKLAAEFDALHHGIRMKGATLGSQQQKLSEMMRPVSQELQQVQAQRDHLAESIRGVMNSLRAAIDAKETALLASLDKSFQPRQAALEAQINRLQSICADYAERAAKAAEAKRFSSPHDHCGVLLAVDTSLDSAPAFPTAAECAPTAHADLSLVVVPATALTAIQRLELENDESFKRRTVSFFSSTVTSMFQGAWPSEAASAGALAGTSGVDAPGDSDEKEAEISAPIEGTFKHESHVGFNPETGVFEVRGVPQEWEQLIGAVDSKVRDQGGSGLQAEEVNYLVSVLKSLDQPEPLETLEYVVAAFDFTAIEPGDLSFKTNDVIAVHRKDESNWWYGSVWTGGEPGSPGLFPSNYVVAQSDDGQLPVPEAKDDQQQQAKEKQRSLSSSKKSAAAPAKSSKPAAPPTATKPENLLESIRQGTKLRKTEPATDKQGKPMQRQETADQLVKALNRLRQAVDGDDDDE